MGAGQIGGIATLLDIDFNNAAGFLGKPANALDAQYVVYYLSHAMMFCAGALIEPHLVLTPAVCVYGEDFKFPVFGGSHKFLQNAGTSRFVENVCIHREYNHTDRCVTHNIALLVLENQFSLRVRELNTDYILNKVRYGVTLDTLQRKKIDQACRYFGWGSRRNGFLLPLLINLRRMDVNVLDNSKCDDMWNIDNKFLCLNTLTCTNDKYGALCPDDLGSVVVCNGYVQGMMTSRLVDRPCGVGFIDLGPYTKFLECAVDDSRDAMDIGKDVPVQNPPLPEVKKVIVDADIDETQPTTCADPDCGPRVTIGIPGKADKIELIKDIQQSSHIRGGKHSKHH